METELEKFRYLKFLGKPPDRPLVEIFDRFSDLFSIHTIQALDRSRTADENLSQVECEARKVLLHILQHGYLRKKTGEISTEIEVLSAATQNEPLDRNRGLIALFDEKIAVLNSAVSDFGLTDFQEYLQKLSGVDTGKFDAESDVFINKTDEAFASRQRDQEISAARKHSIEKMLKSVFPGRSLRSFYREILKNFSFPERNVPQIEVKNAPAALRIQSFSPSIPDRNYIFFPDLSGIEHYSDFLFNFGAVNQNAWTSADLYSRYPEFVYPPQNILRTGYGILFESLLEDDGFIRNCFRIEDQTSIEHLVQTQKLKRLGQIRSRIAAIKFNRAVFALTSKLDEVFESENSLKVGVNAAGTYPIGLISFDDSDRSLLRSSLFGYGLREYLRAKYDFNWWKNRASFEELIDIWNTASRYQPEELANLMGFETSFEFLAESLN